MPVSKDQIYGLLQSELKSEHVEVEDHSDGCGAKFSVTVVSESFKGKVMMNFIFSEHDVDFIDSIRKASHGERNS